MDVFGRMARPSPDGRKLAVSTWDGSLWIYDLVRSTRTRLPTGKVSGTDFLVWTPDGKSVLFTASREGEIGQSIFRQRTDAAGVPEALQGGGTEKHPLCVSPDGTTLLYMSFGGPEERGLWSLPLSTKASAARLLAEPVLDAALSPDGRWLAYALRESGGYEVYVQSFPQLGRKSTISSGGGQNPRWSRDGREIFYRRGDGFFAVRVGPGQELDAAAPELLFRNPDVRGFDVARDGRGFIAVLQPADSGIIRDLHLVTGWFGELTALTSRGK
jgi:serine/threonine-protein kinase